MSRTAALASFLVVVAVGLVGLLAVAAGDERELAFTLGVAPTQVAAELAPGAQACQEPVDVAVPFDAVEVQLGTYGRPGPAVGLAVRLASDGSVIARGRLPSGYPDVTRQPISTGGLVGTNEQVAVCFRNLGSRKVALYGGGGLARRGSMVVQEGADLRTDLTLVFLDRPRSALGLVPDVFDRAAVFRPSWVGSWTFWLLAGLLLGGLPAMLSLAIWNTHPVVPRHPGSPNKSE